MGPVCSSYTAQIYNNNGLLITRAHADNKESARRRAIVKLESIRHMPLSFKSSCIFDLVKVN